MVLNKLRKNNLKREVTTMFKKFLITIVSISSSVAVLIDGYLMFFKHDQSQETAQSQATAASDTESESSTTTSSSSTSSSNSTMKDGTYTGKSTSTGLAVVDCSRTAVRPWLVKKSSTRVRGASTLAASRALVSWLIKAVDRLALAA